MLGDTLRWATDLDASGFASGAQRVNSSLGEMGFRTSAATMNMGGLGTMIGSLASPMTLVAAGAMAVGAALVASAQAAAAWETSMSGVSKTTGLAGQDLNQLSNELLDMSTRMPAAASEIANVAQVAGSLGIAAQDISSFTEVAIQMGVGFEMSADQAATSGAKILTAFKLDTTAENMQKLGSVVNAMGDSFAATEPQVLDFLNRASFLNTTMGQTIPQIAALGTVLISTGLDADVAATGLKSFLNMATSVRSKTGGMDNWAALLNISVEELKANLAGDFNSTLIETANAIAAIEDPVERFQKAVALAGTEGAPAILKLAGQLENQQKALGLTNAEWEKAQSLQKTYTAQSETFNSQMQIFWNVLNMAGTELGTVMLPAINETVKQASALALALIDVGEALSEITGIGQNGGMSAKVYDLTGGLLGMTAEQQNLMAEARKKAQEASVGSEMAKEIEENERLQKAGAEAIQVGIDKGVFKEAGAEIGKELGKNAADEFGNEFIAQANFANLGSLAMLDMINSQSHGRNDASMREFEYLDQQFKMIISKGGSGYYASLFADGKFLGQQDYLRDSPDDEVYGPDAAAIFESITGLPSPEKGSEAYYQMMDLALEALKVSIQEDAKRLNLWDNFSSEASLQKFETDNKEAFDKVSDIVETHLYRAARDIEQNGPVVADLLGSSMGLAAGQVDPATLDESLQNVLDALADPSSVDTAILETSLAHLMGASLISASDSEEIKNAATEAKKNLVGGLAIELPSLLEMIEDPKKISENFENITKFQEGYLIPKITENMDDVKERLTQGVSEDALYEAYIKPLAAVYDQMPPMLQDLMSDLDEGAIDLEKFVELYYSDIAKTADEKSTAASEAVLAADEKFYGSILDSSRTWQDYVNEEGGFAGPTEMYAGYALNKIDRMSASHQINQLFGVSEVGSVGMVADLDTSEALGASEALVSDIAAMTPDMTLTLDVDAAYMTWVNFFADIETTNPTMHVDVEIDAYADEIAAKVEAAIVEALA